ncbi:MAG: LCP family protein [Anaerolineaceae bacterium]|nr:LCP family protein [Anaerolineaceae bacterium]
MPPSRATVEYPTAVSSTALTVADPFASATPTPFQPLPPTQTPQPTPTPKFTPTPTGPVKSEGQVDILLLGSDGRLSGAFRTDTLVLISIKPKSKTVAVVSFPRDLFVTIPGYGENRINTAFASGGFPTLAATFEQNFNFRPDHYVLTNFQGFVRIVDSLGGIEVNVGRRLSDTCDLPQRDAKRYCYVGQGVVRMNGATALWYVRSRYSTNDYDRTRRAQEVLEALFSRLMSLDALTRAPELYESYRTSVATDLKWDDILPLLSVATHLTDPSSIKRFTIGPAEAPGTLTATGGNVLIPNAEAIRAIINQAVYSP